jgi:hypothetical protein
MVEAAREGAAPVRGGIEALLTLPVRGGIEVAFEFGEREEWHGSVGKGEVTSLY